MGNRQKKFYMHNKIKQSLSFLGWIIHESEQRGSTNRGQMDMSQKDLSCVVSPSWNLVLSRICPRLICLEQSSLKMFTKEQKMWSPPGRPETSEYIPCVHKAKRLWNVCVLRQNCNFHFLGFVFKECRKQRKVSPGDQH